MDLLYYRVDTSRFVNNAVLARRVLRCRALPMLLRDLDVLRVEGGGGSNDVMDMAVERNGSLFESIAVGI